MNAEEIICVWCSLRNPAASAFKFDSLFPAIPLCDLCGEIRSAIVNRKSWISRRTFPDAEPLQIKLLQQCDQMTDTLIQ